MMSSENRFTIFGIMFYARDIPHARTGCRRFRQALFPIMACRRSSGRCRNINRSGDKKRSISCVPFKLYANSRAHSLPGPVAQIGSHNRRVVASLHACVVI
jgi:hypothetical protein